MVNIDNDEWLIIDDKLYEYRGHDTSVIIPEGVKYLDDCSDKKIFPDNVKSVTLPKTLQRLGYRSLYNTNLTEIEIPESIYGQILIDYDAINYKNISKFICHSSSLDLHVIEKDGSYKLTFSKNATIQIPAYLSIAFRPTFNNIEKMIIDCSGCQAVNKSVFDIIIRDTHDCSVYFTNYTRSTLHRIFYYFDAYKRKAYFNGEAIYLDCKHKSIYIQAAELSSKDLNDFIGCFLSQSLLENYSDYSLYINNFNYASNLSELNNPNRQKLSLDIYINGEKLNDTITIDCDNYSESEINSIIKCYQNFYIKINNFNFDYDISEAVSLRKDKCVYILDREKKVEYTLNKYNQEINYYRDEIENLPIINGPEISKIYFNSYPAKESHIKDIYLPESFEDFDLNTIISNIKIDRIVINKNLSRLIIFNLKNPHLRKLAINKIVIPSSETNITLYFYPYFPQINYIYMQLSCGFSGESFRETCLKGLTFCFDCNGMEYDEIVKRLKWVKWNFKNYQTILYNIPKFKYVKDNYVAGKINKLELTKKDLKKLKQCCSGFLGFFEDENVLKRESEFKPCNSTDVILRSIDPEVQERLNEINNLTQYLDEKNKKLINNRVQRILNEAECEQESLKPEFKLDSEDGNDIQLTLEDRSLLGINMKVLNILDDIISNIKSSNENIKLVELAKKMKDKVDKDNDTFSAEFFNRECDNLDSKIEYVYAASKIFKIDTFNNELDGILKSISNAIADIFNDTEEKTVLTVNTSNHKLELADKIDELYSKCSNYAWLINSYDGIEKDMIDKELLEDFSDIKYVVNNLDDKHRQSYEQFLKKLKESLIGLNLSVSRKSLEVQVHERLSNFLKDLDESASISAKHKAILDDINNSISILDHQELDSIPNTPIVTVVREIRDDTPISIKNEVELQAKKVLETWKSDIQNDRINLENYMHTFEGMNEEMIIYLLALRDITKIKTKIDDYKALTSEYEDKKIRYR